MTSDKTQSPAPADFNVDPVTETHAATNESTTSGTPPTSNPLVPGEIMGPPDPANQAFSPSVTLAVDPAANSTVVEALRSLSVSDNNVWPKEWKDDDENSRDNLDKFLVDVRRREAHHDSLDVPCRRVTTGEHTRLQPRQWVSLAAADCLEDNLDTEYVALSREVPADQLGKPAVHKMVGSSRQGVEMIIDRKAEIVAFEAQDWEVPPLDIEKQYRDRRTVDRPVDVVSYDRPAADTMRYFEYGNNLMSSALTKNNWRPGQLIGQNGSDPAIIAQSPSFAPPGRQNELAERRSATSTGHVLQYRRPAGVCYGWGGYDEYTTSQSFGRRVPKDMVEKQNWPIDLLSPFGFTNESGEVVETLSQPFTREDILSHPQEPVPLYDKLNSGDRRKPKAPKAPKPIAPTLAWAGTYNDDE
ncbi:hypothetical protein QQX98_009421 [Neonectria punicea]|uniref:G-patch domain-containing protein n=1 Tax=Neonectria punicea TaxID=979145 RepID=A0ABR1GSE5_9HYPO